MVATAVEHEHRVTPCELFFDLVFVFAYTQVATLRLRLADRRGQNATSLRRRNRVV